MHNGIVFLEGPNCSGKTTLALYMTTKLEGFDYYSQYFSPYSWERAEDGFNEYIVLANLYQVRVKLIVDRGMISWFYYNNRAGFDRLNEWNKWFGLLRAWDFARIICIKPSAAILQERALEKNEFVPEEELVEYSRLYDLIPEDLKIVQVVDETNKNEKWMQEICQRIERSI